MMVGAVEWNALIFVVGTIVGAISLAGGAYAWFMKRLEKLREERGVQLDAVERRLEAIETRHNELALMVAREYVAQPRMDKLRDELLEAIRGISESIKTVHKRIDDNLRPRERSRVTD